MLKERLSPNRKPEPVAGVLRDLNGQVEMAPPRNPQQDGEALSNCGLMHPFPLEQHVLVIEADYCGFGTRSSTE